MRHLYCLLLLLVGPLMAPAQSHTAIDSLLESAVAPGTPGINVGILSKGELTAVYSKGRANLDHRLPLGDSSVFDIASVAKQFTAACIYLLVRQDQLQLDTDIRDILPEMPDYGAPIRIRHLLNHSSGLRNYQDLCDLRGFDYTVHPFNNDSVFRLMCRQEGISFAPGQQISYSNSPFNLCATIVERVSGQSLADFARERLFEPLGMLQTRYRSNNTDIIPHRATGYGPDRGGTFSRIPRIETCYGAGSLWSSVPDLAIWARVLMNGHPQFPGLTEWLTAQEVLGSGESAGYARGLMVQDYRGQRLWHHSGYTNGYRAEILLRPDRAGGVIVLTNRTDLDPTALGYQILEWMEGEPVASPGSDAPAPPTEQARPREWVGVYEEIGSCLRMEMALENDTLRAKSSLGREFIPLEWVYGLTYRRMGGNVRYEFARKGEAVLKVYFGTTPFYFRRVELAAPSSFHPVDFAGMYYSKELDVEYRFRGEGNRLVLSYPGHPKVPLHTGSTDAYGNGYRTRYQFIRDDRGRVTGLSVASGGTIEGIRFERREMP